MKDTTFHLRWGSFVAGLLFGLLGVIFFLFATTERRDKIYSSLFGCGIGAVISFFLLKYAHTPGV